MTVVLSPVQLAAVLSGHAITDGEILSNRLWGGLKVVGGSLEMVGAAALLVTPEPTMATKIGGAALGIHGSDTISAGARQVWTGRNEQTLTEQGSSALARRLGASPRTAATIGTAVDVAVPLAVSIGAAAARVAAIRSTSRISLVEHEAVAGSKIGGHTIAKHIGKSEAELRARLAAEPHVPIASTFKSLDVAERLLYRALHSNRLAIESWARTAAPNSKYVEHRSRQRRLREDSMSTEVYPYLEQLLGAYFHQDAFDEAESEADIIRDFKASSWGYQQLGVRADIQRLLHEHSDDLLAAVQRLFNPQVIIGHSDDEARAWLTRLEEALA